MRRYLFLLYGLANYLLFLGVSIYLAGFLLNVGVPRGMDGQVQSPLAVALLVDALLVGVFAIQHSVMARQDFKRWLTRYLPQPIERSTYVLCSNLALILLFWQWQPMGGVIWDVEQPVAKALIVGLFGIGWLIVLSSTWLINHFELFGLRQVWNHFRGQTSQPIKFVTPWPYRLVRHPLYVGWTIVIWATTTMTLPHLLFAGGLTLYMLIAIQLEERDLVAHHGTAYAEYRQRTPMLIPRFASWGNRPQA